MSLQPVTQHQSEHHLGRQPDVYDLCRHKIATLVPSGNETIERITQLILADFPEVSGHYSRIDAAREQLQPDSYDYDSMMECARLLMDVGPDVVCWNGTKAGCVDLEIDRRLCRLIEQKYGTKTCTSALAIDEVMRERNYRSYGLVSPYPDHLQNDAIRVFTKNGFACAGEEHIETDKNFAGISVATIMEMAKRVADAKTCKMDVMLLYCTNFAGAPAVFELEREIGIPVIDSVSIGVWKSLKMLGIDTSRAPFWGSLFAS